MAFILTQYRYDMNREKLLKQLTLFLLVLFGIFPSNGQIYTTVGDLKYSIHNDTQTASVSGFRTSDVAYYNYDLIIPDEITYNDNSYPVVAIDNSAFSGRKITGSLTIGDNVKSIGSSAFSSAFNGYMGVRGKLIIGKSVESIGDNAFNGCNFVGTLDIPNSVKSIGKSAFSGVNILPAH